MVNIRLMLNDFFKEEVGHIGYVIRPSERRKAYGIRMLGETLEFTKILGLKDIIITCDKSNIGSAKVIQNCGGRLDKEFYSETFEEVIQRYVIREKE
ncbi:MAG: GNAT family N-acetyltransferase [Tissierellia bacterium]|nr:GNAT family N-acetyltransferase [Tissierellia bacterium]